jgi:hypothetical protein
MIDSEKRQFQTRGNAQFVEDVAEMMLDPVFVNIEVLGNLLVGVARNHRRNDLQLARSQSKSVASVSGYSPLRFLMSWRK